MRRTASPLVTLLALILVAAPGGQAPETGSVTGRVKLTTRLRGTALPSTAYPTRAIGTHDNQAISEIRNVVVYLQPMPTFDPTGPRVSAVSSSYPLGAQVTVSTRRWDARGAVINTAPTRSFVVGNPGTNPRQTPVLVAGAGITPTIGLRLGASVAQGVYATSNEITRPASQGRSMTMAGGEGEWAFGGTKIGAEILRTAFDAAVDSAVAYECFVQGQQTLTPRWFAAGRYEGTSAPPLNNGIVVGTRTDLKILETTAGYRISPDITLRASFVTRKPYGASLWANQFGASIVWAQRWW